MNLDTIDDAHAAGILTSRTRGVLRRLGIETKEEALEALRAGLLYPGAVRHRRVRDGATVRLVLDPSARRAPAGYGWNDADRLRWWLAEAGVLEVPEGFLRIYRTDLARGPRGRTPGDGSAPGRQ